MKILFKYQIPISQIANLIAYAFMVYTKCILIYCFSAPLEVYLFTVLLAHLHSTANPYVYLVTNIHFRQGYVHLIRKHLMIIKYLSVLTLLMLGRKILAAGGNFSNS